VCFESGQIFIEKGCKFWILISALLKQGTGEELKDPGVTMRSMVSQQRVEVKIQEGESGKKRVTVAIADN